MDLGSRLKDAREKRGLSQDELAMKMHVSRQAVSKWETGRSYPDIEKLLQLSEIFQISLDELVKGDESFRANLIREGRGETPSLTILGAVFAALGVVVGLWGGADYPLDLMNSDFMSFLVGGLVLLFIGLALIRSAPVWLLLGTLYATAAATVVYLVGFWMPFYVLLSGIVVVAGMGWWLTVLLLRRRTRAGRI